MRKYDFLRQEYYAHHSIDEDQIKLKVAYNDSIGSATLLNTSESKSTSTQNSD